MQLNNPVIVVGIFFLVVFFVALVLGLIMQRRRAVSDASDGSAPGWVGSMRESPASAGERIASPISEVIEEMVQQRMAGDPSLQGLKIDFGTSADGALEIWIDAERYSNVDDIRDSRIRTLIQEAVAAYNEGNA
jgi:hypothetical protein